ncbi:PREDICTED: pre-mRNA 3'-end-processing factor FIP1-like isoform X2 [Thamnophis sirtalis]|uniref:Pre-mRNA 3'-end-processing factor FIP1-like isoform X2 n=1 Tax=Thamnophis sirtalis TaxID=35019 RepID=A0A6I9Z0H0_9SAUR|nr:PREDICTED: pre-mRNA 3'-end-processing factor FIP1-like isoform X2 [Thamnophis sirtalis]
MAAHLEPLPAAELEAEDDEEQWLYGDDNGKAEDGPISGHNESHPLQDIPKETRIVISEDQELLQQLIPSGEDEEEESDSDDDDIRVTIGNIKTGAPPYMGTPMNLNLKTGRGYGAPASAKSQPKGIDLEASGNVNGLPVIEVDLESFEDKPWRKPGADLSDYFNYGFNEETWKAYCEKQRRLQLGLEPSVPICTENKITVQQGRIGNAEKEPENNIIKMDFKTDFVALVGGRIKAGPPPNRKLGGTIDVIGGQAGTIRRVEGRRRDKHASEENPIQVLGDHGSKTQPAQPPQQQPFVPPAGPPPALSGPPPHFLHPPPPQVASVPPPLHPPGLFPPPPLAPPPALLIPTLDGQPASYSNRQPPPFGYNSTVTMTGTVIIAGNAVTILSMTTAGVEIAVVSEKIVTGKGGTERKKRAANINHHGASSMRVKKGKATVDTSTKRTSATKRRRKQVKMDLQKKMNRTPRSSEPGLCQPRVVAPLQPMFPFGVIFFMGECLRRQRCPNMNTG